MRLLHVISGLGLGGAEHFLAALAPRLAQRGFEQVVASVMAGDGPIATELSARGIPVVALEASPGNAPFAVAKLVRIMRTFAPHGVQGWMYHGDLFATLARALNGRPRPKLYWGIRCSDMNLDDYALQLRLVVRTCAWLSARPDLVVANSEAGVKAHVVAGYRPRTWAVIPNGIDAERFRPSQDARRQVRRELGIAPGTSVIVHVARVDPMKDHGTLLAAARELPDVVTVLAGKDTERLADLPRVIALGARDDVARILAAGDLIVSSSAYGEGFSNAIAEGMAVGLVPVATDVGDARSIVGDVGTIVRPRMAAELAKAIRTALAAGPETLSARGIAARRRIISEFSIERAADRFADVYRGVGSERSPAA